ncbi:hypothetical protein PROFUN_03574 [Planoprotostelium fungivorum]|uniref:Importin subunit beta-1/Transportin-1-like TPR repeats domain-containing protein n=1 Tax=Planoprotostelium fungivorum TaxID=1890364 RepID=A0A2P6MSG9_9EUKA|nr:hypothetical protein PROFUN_03574 [Planoprotostelium fungivorum]
MPHAKNNNMKRGHSPESDSMSSGILRSNAEVVSLRSRTGNLKRNKPGNAGRKRTVFKAVAHNSEQQKKRLDSVFTQFVAQPSTEHLGSLIDAVNSVYQRYGDCVLHSCWMSRDDHWKDAFIGLLEIHLGPPCKQAYSTLGRDTGFTASLQMDRLKNFITCLMSQVRSIPQIAARKIATGEIAQYDSLYEENFISSLSTKLLEYPNRRGEEPDYQYWCLLVIHGFCQLSLRPEDLRQAEKRVIIETFYHLTTDPDYSDLREEALENLPTITRTLPPRAILEKPMSSSSGSDSSPNAESPSSLKGGDSMQEVDMMMAAIIYNLKSASTLMDIEEKAVLQCIKALSIMMNSFYSVVLSKYEKKICRTVCDIMNNYVRCRMHRAHSGMKRFTNRMDEESIDPELDFKYGTVVLEKVLLLLASICELVSFQESMEDEGDTFLTRNAAELVTMTLDVLAFSTPLPQECDPSDSNNVVSFNPTVYNDITLVISGSSELSACCLSFLGLITPEVLTLMVQLVGGFLDDNLNSISIFRGAAAGVLGTIQGAHHTDELNAKHFDTLLALATDPTRSVRSSAVWTLGCIIRFNPHMYLASGNDEARAERMTQLVDILLQGVEDVPSVALNSAWTLHNLNLESEYVDQFPIDHIISKLIATTKRIIMTASFNNTWFQKPMLSPADRSKQPSSTRVTKTSAIFDSFSSIQGLFEALASWGKYTSHASSMQGTVLNSMLEDLVVQLEQTLTFPLPVTRRVLTLKELCARAVLRNRSSFLVDTSMSLSKHLPSTSTDSSVMPFFSMDLPSELKEFIRSMDRHYIESRKQIQKGLTACLSNMIPGAQDVPDETSNELINLFFHMVESGYEYPPPEELIFTSEAIAIKQKQKFVQHMPKMHIIIRRILRSELWEAVSDDLLISTIDLIAEIAHSLRTSDFIRYSEQWIGIFMDMLQSPSRWPLRIRLAIIECIGEISMNAPDALLAYLDKLVAMFHHFVCYDPDVADGIPALCAAYSGVFMGISQKCPQKIDMLENYVAAVVELSNKVYEYTFETGIQEDLKPMIALIGDAAKVLGDKGVMNLNQDSVQGLLDRASRNADDPEMEMMIRYARSQLAKRTETHETLVPPDG